MTETKVKNIDIAKKFNELKLPFPCYDIAFKAMFTDEEEQREAASLFHTSLPKLETRAEEEKAFRDIILSVKRNSYEYYTSRLGTDVNALKQVIDGKKALEELARTHISLD